MSLARTPFLVALAATAAACGGGPSPSGPGPVPTPTPGSPVSGYVYYDENANGTLGPTETVRLPGVTVAVASATGQSAAGGRFTVASAPNGPGG